MGLITRRKLLKLATIGCFILTFQYVLIANREKGNVTSRRYKKLTIFDKAKQKRVDDKGLSKTITNYTGAMHSWERTSRGNGLDAVMDYCNSPSTKTSGNEGQGHNGLALRMVHVFTRHGGSTSIYRLPGFEADLYSCKFGKWYSGSDAKIKSFPQYMDKMAGKQPRRNHFLNWALYPNKDYCTESVLTSRGALQHIQLGIHLYTSYKGHYRLVNRDLSFHKQIQVKSTGNSKTYQSAVALLYGLLPSFNISLINIDYSINPHFCPSTFQKTCYCKLANDLQSRKRRFQNEFSRNNSQHIMLQQYLWDILDLEQPIPLSAIAEVVIQGFCHDLPLPCSFLEPSKCVNRDVIAAMWKTLKNKELSNLADPEFNTIKYCCIVMFPVLVEVLHNMKDIIENRPTPKLVLYSGHDVTISSLRYVLGIHDGTWPPFASRIVIELFQELTTDTFYIKVLYNGVDKTKDVVFCQGKTYKGLCNFKIFAEYVLTKMLKQFGFSQYYSACSK